MGDRSALVLVDAQVRFLLGPPEVYRVDDLLGVVSSLRARARAAGIPVVYVAFDDDDAQDGARIHPSIAPLAGDQVVVKRSTCSFHRTGLHRLLKDRGVSRLVIAGCITELCVDTTCRRSLGLGYETILVADGHSTPDRPLDGITAAQRISLTNHVLSRVGTGERYVRVVRSADVDFE